MAKNDWIVAGLNNPDFTPYDFSVIADMSLNNTQMLSKDEYLKSDFIKNHELFKDESGNFSNDKFNQYYNHKLMEFREFQIQEFPKGPQLDMFDTDRTKKSRVKDIRFDLGRQVNPDRQAVGIEGVNLWSDPTQTKSEIAQSQKIWDTAKQEFKDYSSNDRALSNGVVDWIKQVFSDPLVMAQWEEDGEHIDPITGLTKTHKKGDYKLNDKGTYYYETLNNRSPIGKEVLSIFDTLTVDGEGINKYDFFDSDDVEKSIAGVIAKNVVAILPLFTPLASVYSTALIAKEFSKALPMLYGFATILSDNQDSPKWINNIAAIGSKFSGSTSQYAKENTFSFENFGNLISDVALQWGQQKVIASAFNKLRGSNTYVDDALKNAQNLYKTKAKELGESEELWKVCQNKFLPEAQKLATQAGQLGRNMSMAYMAIVSNSDLYNEMRNMGLTNTEAASVALGSTLGMFALNKYTGLGEIFFDDATDDAVKLARQAIKTEMKDAVQMFKQIKQSNLSEPNKYLKYIKIASDKAKGVLENFNEDLKYHTLNFAGKAVGEGLEEVSEELISDVAKEIYQLAGQFGVDTTLKDIGAWDNALERYTMSFFGGAIGGGIFYGKEALIDGKSFKRDLKNQELATLIRNGHANELRAEIEKLNKKGKLGNTKLSASKYETDENGEKVWLTTENKEESQNDAIAKAMLEKINALEAVINNNRVGLTDEQLFENMVLAEKRYKRYEKIAPLTNYYKDFNSIVTNLIAAELDFKKASQTVEGTVNGTPLTDIKLTPEQEVARQEQLLKLKERVDEFRKKKDEFLAGDTSLEYTRKLNFLMDPMLHSQFLSIDKEQFFIEKYGTRSYAELSPEEMIRFELDWQEKVQSTLKEEINQAWESYKAIEQKIIPELEILSENTGIYKQFSLDTKKLFEGVLNINKLFESYINYDTQLEGESDEMYQARNNRIIIDDVEETPEQFQLRKLNRIKQIDAYNTQKDQEWANKVNEHLNKVGYKVDPFTFRYLRRALPQRQKDIVDKKLALTLIPPSIRQIFKQLKSDLSNVDEVKQNVSNLIHEEYKKEISQIINDIKSMEIVDSDGNNIDLDSYVAENEEFTLSEILDDPSILGFENSELIEKLQTLVPVLGEDTSFTDIISLGTYLLNDNENLKNYSEQKASIHHNTLDVLISDVVTNPIYNLADSVKKTIKNPIGELIKSLAAKNGEDLSDIDELLDIIQFDFDNIDDVNQLLLDDTQMDKLKKVRDYMKLINGFMYAASSNPDKNNPFGHNQVINNFAKKNKDKLIKEWKPLPEIDSDYFVLYNQAIAQYESEIDYWIKLSNNNNVNKIRKFVATDKAFNIALYDAIKSKDMKFTIDDIEYNLLEGFAEGTEEPEIKLFNAEQLIYNNFQRALRKSGLSVNEFLKKSGLLEKLIPSINNIVKQRVANLSDTLKSSDLTDFDLMQYFAQVFTLNPSKFNSELKSRVTKNEKIAPITAQEYATKLAQAITYQQYRDFMRYAYEKSGSRLPFLSNTLILPGVAGAGKTVVVLSSVNDPSEEVIVAGPTKIQADKLKKSLNRPVAYTFNELLQKLLGNDQYNNIKAEFDKVKITKDQTSYDCEFFTVEQINGSSVVKLKRDAIKFQTLENIPKKLFLDEATHLSALEIQILDAYAESVGAVNYMAGDPNQRGAYNRKAKTENIQEDQIFSSRAPKLSISLRDNNLQKYLNQESVRSLLDLVNDTFLDSTADELISFWPIALNTMSKFNFKVYNHDEINGDLITPDLSSELILKLKQQKTVEEGGEQKKIPNTIGFIGDKTSPYLQKLKEAGIDPIVLSMEEMQGEEFDYVIIDHKWKKPDPNYDVKIFLTDLYTAMTRARTASIFIDNGLSDIIGKNIISNNKSKAPSILAGVDELRAKKLEILNKLKFDLNEEIKEEKKEKEEKVSRSTEEDFIDPDNKNIDQEITQELIKTVEEEKIKEENTLTVNFSADGEQLVETFSDITILGAQVTEPQERIVQHNGKDITLTVPVWKVNHPTEGPLRNLQALYDDQVEFIKYSDKEQAQQHLFNIKSCILYQHSYDDLPRHVKQKIYKKDWESGTLELEIREITDSDNTHLNAYYNEPGIEYDGKKYIINIVFTTKLKSGQIAKFDVSGLPSLDKYKEHINQIKTNLEARISKATGDEKTKLQNQLNNVDFTYANYVNLLKSWITEFNNGTFKPIELPQDAISFNQTTWFQDLKKSARSAGIQLGGKINPVTGERSRDSLQKRHPELIFSPIYTYATDPDWFEKQDSSLKGKAVVFVTSDTLLQSDQLIEEYVSQKSDPENSKARVRMLILDNYGMTFNQFIDKDFIGSFQKGDETRKPFRQNYTGIRMFTSLWNWRAALIQFNEALDKWKQNYSYTDKQLNILLEASQMVYDGQDPKEFLNNNGLNESDLEKLNEFNTKDCENIAIFRLGYSKNGNGFYVREEDVSKSTQYDKNKVNLLAITPEKAKQFLGLINRILSAIEYNENFGSETLGLRLLKDNGEPWGKDEAIDIQGPDGAKHRRTLSGLLSDDNGTIILQANGKNIEYEGGNQWSIIPSLVSNLVRTITYFQHHADELDNTDQQCAKCFIKKEKETKVFLKTQIGDLFSSGLLNLGDDNSLFHLLDLVFHGTIDDIHKPLTAGQSLQQVEDAYFKRGFFINPDVTRLRSKNGDYEIWHFDDDKGNVLFYKIDTSEELFTVDTNVRTAGLGLRINKIFEEKREEEKREELKIDPVDKFKSDYPELSSIIDMANDEGQNLEYSLEDESLAMDWYNDFSKRSIKIKIQMQVDSILDTPFETTSKNGIINIVTFKDHITSQIGSDNFTIEFKGDEFIVTSNGINYTMNDDFTFNKNNVSPETVKSKYKTILSNGKSFDKNLLLVLNDLTPKLQESGITTTDIFELANILSNIFNSNHNDDTIKQMLDNLSENNTYIELMATMLSESDDNSNYKDMLEILNYC